MHGDRAVGNAVAFVAAVHVRKKADVTTVERKTAPENSSKRYLEIYFCTLHTYRQLQHKITRLKK